MTGTSGGGFSTGSSGGSSSSGTGSSGAPPSSGANEAGPSSGPVTIAEIFETTVNNSSASVEDSFILFPCLRQNPLNCVTDLSCPNEGSNATWVDGQGLMSGNKPVGFQTHEYFQLGGALGTTYLATITVNGVTEGKGYLGGTRAAGNSLPEAVPTGIDMFYTGGTPNQPNSDESNYNIYEIIVWSPPPGAWTPRRFSETITADIPERFGSEVQHYFLNSFPDEGGADVTKSFDNFSVPGFPSLHQIPVPGGGILEYATQDANCLAVDNCGLPGAANHNVACGSSTSIDIPNDPSAMRCRRRTWASLCQRSTASTRPVVSRIIFATFTASRLSAVTPIAGRFQSEALHACTSRSRTLSRYMRTPPRNRIEQESHGIRWISLPNETHTFATAAIAVGIFCSATPLPSPT